MLDVVVYWGDGEGKKASERERWKRRRYRRAMWANVRQGMSYAAAAGWADKEDREGEVAATEIDEMLAPATCPQRFVPLSFEANGAFGQSTIDFLQLVVDAADQGKSADLYHWSAHVFGSIGGSGRGLAPASDKWRTEWHRLEGAKGNTRRTLAIDL